jgi:hypothetical protein
MEELNPLFKICNQNVEPSTAYPLYTYNVYIKPPWKKKIHNCTKPILKNIIYIYISTLFLVSYYKDVALSTKTKLY